MRKYLVFVYFLSTILESSTKSRSRQAGNNFEMWIMTRTWNREREREREPLLWKTRIHIQLPSKSSLPLQRQNCCLQLQQSCRAKQISRLLPLTRAFSQDELLLLLLRLLFFFIAHASSLTQLTAGKIIASHDVDDFTLDWRGIHGVVAIITKDLNVLQTRQREKEREDRNIITCLMKRRKT